MIRLNSFQSILFMASFCLLSCKQDPKPVPDKEPIKPNIVFLYTDDQTFASVRALGNEEIYTPNLDRIVNSGTSFTHANNMGGWHRGICVATPTMTIYDAYMNLQRTIQKYGFELLVYPKINGVLLFAMRNDPNKMNDLARQPQY